MYLFHASKLGHSYHWREEPCVSLVFMASGCGFTLGGPLGLPSTLWAKPDVVSLAHNGGPPQGEFTIPRGWCKLFARGYSNTAKCLGSLCPTRIWLGANWGWPSALGHPTVTARGWHCPYGVAFPRGRSKGPAYHSLKVAYALYGVSNDGEPSPTRSDPLSW